MRGAEVGEDGGQGFPVLAGPFAHDADLNPVLAEQAAAVVGEPAAGFLELRADYLRRDFRRERNGDDGGRDPL